MDIGACICITGNAAAYGIDNAKDKRTFASCELNGSKGIGRFATLRDGKNNIIRADDRIPISELRGILNLHGYLTEGLEELLANEASVPTGATGHNDEPVGFQEPVTIKVDCREVDAIALVLGLNLQALVHGLQAATHTVFEALGLVEDLFEHEVGEAALVKHIQIDINLGDININVLGLKIRDFHLTASLDADNLLVVDIHHMRGVFGNGGGIGGNEELTVLGANANDQRTALARGNEHVGLATVDEHNGIGANDLAEGIAYG